MTTIDAAALAALDAKATQGHLFAQSPDYDDGGVSIVATDYPPDNMPTNGMVFWATMSPVERDQEDGLQAIANAAFLCELVNAYRAGDLVLRTTAPAEVARLTAEMQRRDDNENRNCLNWGPCSRHDGRMSEMTLGQPIEAEPARVREGNCADLDPPPL